MGRTPRSPRLNRFEGNVPEPGRRGGTTLRGRVLLSSSFTRSSLVVMGILFCGVSIAQAEDPPPGAEETSPGVVAPEPQADRDGVLSIQREVPKLIPRNRRSRSKPSGASGPGLEALLQLPSGFRTLESPSVAGADESEWRRRFLGAERALVSAQEDLARTKRELDEVAEGGSSSQWSVAPPGASTTGGPSTSPLSFKHREAMRRNRENLDIADRALRELKIEADLAGVPAAWRSAEPPGSSRALKN
jgi:hypothetical protein